MGMSCCRLEDLLKKSGAALCVVLISLRFGMYINQTMNSPTMEWVYDIFSC